MTRTRGFTLIELLVVIIIIVIIAGTTVALMNTFFRGQGTRKAATQVIVAFAQTKQLAADQRVVHFMVLTNLPDGGRITICKDTNQNKTFDGVGTDKPIEARPIDLPKYVVFKTFPPWIGIHPTGYCNLGGAMDVNAGSFDAADANGTELGDIVMEVQGKPYRVCLDVDKGSGKVRRWFFLAQ